MRFVGVCVSVASVAVAVVLSTDRALESLHTVGHAHDAARLALLAILGLQMTENM